MPRLETYEIGGYVFRYPTYFEGDVHVARRQLRDGMQVGDPDNVETVELGVIPAYALVALVAQAYVHPRRQRALNAMTPQQLLGLEHPP